MWVRPLGSLVTLDPDLRGSWDDVLVVPVGPQGSGHRDPDPKPEPGVSLVVVGDGVEVGRPPWDGTPTDLYPLVALRRTPPKSSPTGRLPVINESRT